MPHPYNDDIPVEEGAVLSIIEDLEKVYHKANLQHLAGEIHSQMGSAILTGYQALFLNRLNANLARIETSLRDLSKSFSKADENAHELTEALESIRRQISANGD